MTSSEMPVASLALSVESTLETDRDGDAAWTFEAVYQSYASFVWRNARRLGVPPAALDDVMQEVFLVVHRRLATFEERTSVRAWLSAILINVVRARRRTTYAKDGPRDDAPRDPYTLADARTPSPLEQVERDEAVRELYTVLTSMNEGRREVLVLAELEEMTAPEIAHALNVNVNTIYFRLRTARREFEKIVVRRQAARKTGER